MKYPLWLHRGKTGVDIRQQDDASYRRYLEALDRLTPEQRLNQAFELSEMTRWLVMQGIRERFPDAPPEEHRRVLMTILDRCHNNNY